MQITTATAKKTMTTTTTKKLGQPTKKTAAICNEICKRLADGEPLAQICRDKKMPCPNSVRNWMEKDKELNEAIARAREDGEDKIAADCLEIADNATNDYMAKQDGEGATAYALNGEHIQRSKLRIETRLKLLAKWNPKKYGDRTSLEHTGKDGAPIELTITKKVV